MYDCRKTRKTIHKAGDTCHVSQQIQFYLWSIWYQRSIRDLFWKKSERPEDRGVCHANRNVEISCIIQSCKKTGYGFASKDDRIEPDAERKIYYTRTI